MRFSLLTILIGFLLFAVYLGWEQGAFRMKKMELKTQSVSLAGYSPDVSSFFNQALKSPIQPLMKNPAMGGEVLLPDTVSATSAAANDNKNKKTGGSSVY